MFHNAHNVAIIGGELLNVAGNYYNYHGQPISNEVRKQRALKQLFEHIAPGAFHNSAERHDPPKCHPHTREAVLRDILVWARNPSNFRLLMWIYGPAGAGKSAIMQTMAEMCEREGILGASFFFFRTADKRNTSKHLVTTLAYQLALKNPHFAEHIANAIHSDPSVFSRNLESQMTALILEPMNAAAANNLSSSQWLYLILIDGLDECSPEGSHCEIITLLSKSASSTFRFLIASRPELVIRNTFNLLSIQTQTETLGLDDEYLPDNDIQFFLKDKFQNIKANHSVCHLIPNTWPSEDDLCKLVQNSSGQFIYAATIIKFIECPRNYPVAHLEMVLKTRSDSTKPFAQLDALYHQIFSMVEHIEKVLSILLLEIICPSQFLHHHEAVLGYSYGNIQLILSDMHSLVQIKNYEQWTEATLHFYHTSLRDFLLDPLRSKHLYLHFENRQENILVCMVNQYNGLQADSHEYFHEVFIKLLPTCHLTSELANALCGFNLTNGCSISQFDGYFHHLWIESLDVFLKWLKSKKTEPLQQLAAQLYNCTIKYLHIWLSGELSQEEWSSKNQLIALLCALSMSEKDINSFYLCSRNSFFGITGEPLTEVVLAIQSLMCNIPDIDDPIGSLLSLYLDDINGDGYLNITFCAQFSHWLGYLCMLLSNAEANLALGEKLELLQGRTPNIIKIGPPYYVYCKARQDMPFDCPDYEWCTSTRRAIAMLRIKQDLYNLAISSLNYLQKCGIVVERHDYNSEHLICCSCQSSREFIEDPHFLKGSSSQEIFYHEEQDNKYKEINLAFNIEEDAGPPFFFEHGWPGEPSFTWVSGIAEGDDWGLGQI